MSTTSSAAIQNRPTSETDPRNRRRGQRIRIKIGLDVRVSTLGTRTEQRFSTVDISESGALISSESFDRPFGSGAILQIRMVLGDGQKPIDCLAKETRVTEDRSLGIRFIHIEERDVARLQGYLVALAEKHPELKC